LSVPKVSFLPESLLNLLPDIVLNHLKLHAIDSFWHYIARIPINCIGSGKLGEHYLYGKVIWRKPVSPQEPWKGSTKHESWRILRILISKNGFAKFDPKDHYYDIHVHTIAEQTTWSPTNVDAARRAFGGPLAMLMEAAYAIGLVDVQLKDGNWPAFKNRIATTDHNVFYSAGHFDSGKPPKYGPTSRTDGHRGEFEWYRNNLGILGGEEVTLEGTGRVITSAGFDSMGSHFLAYGAPHFEGPWHGGRFKPRIDSIGTDVPFKTGVINPISIDTVMHIMSSTNGFGYAAHPFSRPIGWSRDMFQEAIGLKRSNDGNLGSPILQNSGKDFIFKGSQVWNGKEDMVSAKNLSGGKLEYSEVERFDPFTPRNSGQVFQPNLDWDKTISDAKIEFFSYVRDGLVYSFKQSPEYRFIRKLYMSAGTDAHGDFNYVQSGEATAVAEFYAAFYASANEIVANNNAFGRVRTYVLTSERKIKAGDEAGIMAVNPPVEVFVPGVSKSSSAKPPKPPFESVMAYREGNTVLTDGPICTFSTDANCRFNSDSDKLSWHDQLCTWENYDGTIGGKGSFDGGGTMLAPHRNPEVWVRTKWNGRNDYFSETEGQPDTIRFDVQPISIGLGSTSAVIPSGEQDKVIKNALTGFFGRGRWEPSAITLRGVLGSGSRKSMCLTNPIWSVPYNISIQKPKKCPIKPNELKITVSFGVSMDIKLGNKNCIGAVCARQPDLNISRSYEGIQVSLKPLDENGESHNAVYNLSGNRRWWPHYLNGSGLPRIQDAVYTVTNVNEIPCAANGWDTETHTKKRNVSSYVVVVSDIFDMHLNQLNAIASPFTIKNIITPKRPDAVLPPAVIKPMLPKKINPKMQPIINKNVNGSIMKPSPRKNIQ